MGHILAALFEAFQIQQGIIYQKPSPNNHPPRNPITPGQASQHLETTWTWRRVPFQRCLINHGDPKSPRPGVDPIITETSPGMILQHVQVPKFFWGWVFPYIRRIHPAYIADPDIFHHQGYMTDLGGLVVAYALAAGSFATGSISGGPEG